MNEEQIKNKIKKLEAEIKELKNKHIHMENAIKKKAGMLEPIRKEGWKFKKC